MKALTVLQPHASRIARGEKRVENRSWSTKYRGPLAIHAGSGSTYLDKSELVRFPTGVVVAVAELVDCLSVESIQEMGSNKDTMLLKINSTSRYSWKFLLDHAHTEGPYCWILESIQKVSHHPKITGKQKLWEIDESILIKPASGVEIIDICPGCEGIYYEGPSECDCGFSGKYHKAEMRRL